MTNELLRPFFDNRSFNCWDNHLAEGKSQEAIIKSFLIMKTDESYCLLTDFVANSLAKDVLNLCHHMNKIEHIESYLHTTQSRLMA